MPVVLQSRIYRADLKANPHVLYVFGDNEQRWGLGGQAAEMRNEPNAVGVATLSFPSMFWSDAHAAHQCAVIDKDMEPLFQAMRDGLLIVFPLDGIGTGLADLANRSPVTFAHLQKRVAELRSTEEVF